MRDIPEIDIAALSDATLLQWLVAKDHRPNVLVECAPAAIGQVARHLLRSCAAPYRRVRLPGSLDLSKQQGGTLLLENVAALSMPQQRALHEWISSGASTQVISVTTTPLTAAVANGQFLEELFYRLNVVRIDGPAAGSVLLSAALLSAEQGAPSRWSLGSLLPKRPLFDLRAVQAR